MTSVAEKLQRKAQRPAPNKQVRLRLVYIDFWSAVKLSFLIALCLGIVLVVATFLVWTILEVTQVFSALNDVLVDVVGEGFDLMAIVSLPQVLLFSIVVAVLNVITLTVLGAVAAGLYNLTVKLTGGLLVGFTNN
jgi:uncharacterized membrane protein SpoIIM required for sporulation